MQKKKYVCEFSHTNAHFLDEVKAERMVEIGLDEVVISLDGVSQQTYTKYHKEGDFQKVIESMKLLAERKNRKKRKCSFAIL